jgi:hypothetical protein
MNGLRNRKDRRDTPTVDRSGYRLVFGIIFSAYSFLDFGLLVFLLDFRRLPFSRR